MTRVTELYHERIVIASLEIQGKKDIHLYGLHLNSKTQKDDVTQLLINNIAATEIHGFMKARHSRAILVGDFNHNPFDGFMTGRHTLNAVANKEIAKKLKTRSYNNDYDKKTIFYNPMWNLLGDFDLATGQAKFNGSFFYADERHKMLQHIHWNLFDQVLVSAPICDSVLPSEIKLISDYVDNVGITHSLAGSEFYEKRNNFHNPDYSDHLPLLFKVDETKL